ncbi:preprotein translocase subunit SecE [Allopseudospirillum japonicum]|uniref:Protein translocase subunit SecE n=1 Tax=Allopseudospirillum japonicum TaxID=64971 RepID=A0A1H6UA63_9GAMM|nr:preprotein translocase subunit SecE [Allopseudospirillum japonicum]SEI89278.1 preprotein translocase subunit SecE [Allopseudospirillum japonicum]
MNAKTDAPEARFDGLKWGLVFALVAVAVAGNGYFSDESLLYRVLGVVVVAVIAATIALRTAKGQKFLSMARDARAEIRKVIWPTRQETTQTTLIVLAAVFFMALLLWIIDSLLSWLLEGFIA